jgi:AcrR family transcriptional regulator
LAAAEQVFMRDGYGAATMEDVARVAGMSKKAVYGLYPDKRHLFAAVIANDDAFPKLDAPAPEHRVSPRDALRNHLLAMVEFVLSPRQVAMTRLMISEAGHSPELADEFYARVMSKRRAYLAEGLARMPGEEDQAKRDVVKRASTLFDAALGSQHLTALLGRQTKFSRRQLLAQIDLAMATTLP